MRFQSPAEALGRFYDVYAFRVGAPEEHHVAVLFNDITDRKRTEEAFKERFLGQKLVERRWALPALIIGSVAEVAVLFAIDQLESPRGYLGLPGPAATLIGVLAAVLGGPLVGAIVALVGGLAYFVFITDLGATVVWPTIVGSIVLYMLAAIVAGIAADRIRTRATVRETLLSQSVKERDDLLGSLQTQTNELARMHEELGRSHKQQRSLVQRLERAFLDVPGSLPHVDFGHEYRSATTGVHIGGDFLDITRVSDGRLALLIGDVSGHGLEASRMATMVKDSVATLVQRGDGPGVILGQANTLLVDRNYAGFVTAFLGVLDPKTGRLTYASAGHPPPYVADPEGAVRVLDTAPSPPLGAFPGTSYGDQEVYVDDRTLLFLYTDGLTEARRDGEFYGDARLANVLEEHKEHAASELPGMVLAEVLEFSGGSMRDDTAILTIRYRLEDGGTGT
jgi:serine phosphatase RsbU (regulator of sigma subunit)